MKKIALITAFGFFLAANAFAQEFTLKSADVSGQLTKNQVFSGFGCQGKNM